MAYKEWTIGGITPSWVEPEFHDDRESRTLTLKCAAIFDETGTDPVTEIDNFDAMASEKINNELLLNGGSKLQAQEIFEVTASNDGGSQVKLWPRCALRKVKVDLDSYYNEENIGSSLEYELVIDYETLAQGGSDRFLGSEGFPGDYTNIACYRNSTQAGEPCTNCTNFGYMEITTTKNVRKVRMEGAAYRSYDATPAWIECNGDRVYWAYNAEGDLPVGFEELEWEITPSTLVVLQTSNHVNPFTGSDGLGCWPLWIELYYE